MTKKNPLSRKDGVSGAGLSRTMAMPIGGFVRAENVLARLSDGSTSPLPESRAAQRQMLADNQIDSIMFDAQTFQDEYPNANFVRFRDEDLGDFATSFENGLFLRNHEQRDIGSRDGTIVESAAVRDGARTVFHQKVEITTAKGMLSFIEGQIDRFSIGWDASQYTCSVCGNDFLDYTLCSHWPGRSYAINEGEDEQLCELIMEEPTGFEVSAVNNPAVSGTRLLQQLTLMKQDSAPALEEPKMETENEILGTEEEEVAVAAETQEEGAPVASLEELTEFAENAFARIEELGAEIAAVTADNQALRVEVAELRTIVAASEGDPVANHALNNRRRPSFVGQSFGGASPLFESSTVLGAGETATVSVAPPAAAPRPVKQAATDELSGSISPASASRTRRAADRMKRNWSR